MAHSRLRIARVQARAVKRAKTDGLSPKDTERVKRSGDAAVAFARRVFGAQTGEKKKCI